MSVLRVIIATSAGVALVVGSVSPSSAVASVEPTTSYLVETAPNASTEAVSDLVESTGGDVTETLTEVIDGVSAELSESEVADLLASPNVAAVYEHQPITLTDTQTDAPWGLSRLDQAALPVDSTYTYPTSAGTGIPVYVVDTGATPNASQYQSRLLPGQNFAADRTVGGPNPNTSDCDGHGSHVAGIVGSATYGVAKGATIVPVRVFECDGYGDTEALFGALDWIATQPIGVVNLSLSVTSGNFPPLDDAVTALVNAGYVVVVAAGNNNGLNACNYSPGSAPSALTVGATTSTDQRASYSNIGPCIDLFAPGSAIPSLSHTSTTGSVLKSGTSMATPHAAGAAALMWAVDRGVSSLTIQDRLNTYALVGAVGSAGAGSPNRLLSVSALNSEPSSLRTMQENFVRALYQDFLNREATANEVSSWTQQLLTNQIDRYGVATALSRSNEWISTVISGFYRDTLNREPDPAGLQGWVNAAKAGMPIAQVASAFYSSPEYFTTTGQSSFRIWVTDLYVKLLLRSPDQGGIDGWVRALNSGMPRDMLTFGFYQSEEKVTVRINALYQKLLGRQSEPGGAQGWAPFVVQQGDIVLAAALAASNEYFERAQAN